ncbi:hypothetical protein KIPB_006719 [Kipferlia bialata]|uniref:Uncharacterized protein n=1 Tax=Kipferlia bialata TaxID=797122 RepID=A0A9K3CY19_9EUKA|nr:hypothetical protein KIPB_006719 [Kipferlia bialata]|eukprot:g6719.t1
MGFDGDTGFGPIERNLDEVDVILGELPKVSVQDNQAFSEGVARVRELLNSAQYRLRHVQSTLTSIERENRDRERERGKAGEDEGEAQGDSIGEKDMGTLVDMLETLRRRAQTAGDYTSIYSFIHAVTSLSDTDTDTSLSDI